MMMMILLSHKDDNRLLPAWTRSRFYRPTCRATPRFANGSTAKPTWGPNSGTHTSSGVHDRGEHEGQLWIAVDFVDGTDAQHLLADHYPAGMPADEVATIMTAVAGALAYDHRGLLPRDVKPANIMLADLDDDGDNESF